MGLRDYQQVNNGKNIKQMKLENRRMLVEMLKKRYLKTIVHFAWVASKLTKTIVLARYND